MAAVGAEPDRGAVGSPATGAVALGVDSLQLGRLAGEDVHAHVVADRHLVEGAAQIGLHHGELLEQAVPLRAQLRVLAHGSACPVGVAGASPGSPPTTITSGRFCWALM